MAQQLRIPTRIHEDVGLIPGSFSGLRIWCCQKLWLLMHDLRAGHAVAVGGLAAVGLIRPLAWEPPCTAGGARKKMGRQEVRVRAET